MTCVVVGVGTAGITLNRFPAVNFDEVANAVMADQFPVTGRVHYALMFDVVDPAFEALTASGQEGLRGLYTRTLALMGRFFGSGYSGLRLLSLVLWCMTGALLSLRVKWAWGTGPSLLMAAIFSLTMDGVLSAHLIRPDVFLGLTMVVMVCLMTAEGGRTFWKWLGAGILAASSVGFHPHGLLWIVWSFIAWGCNTKGRRTSALSGLLTGLAIGVVVFFFTVDVTTYTLGKYSYVGELYRRNALIWIDRLLPIQLIKSSVSLFTNPDSFYFPKTQAHPFLWRAAGIATFLGYLVSGVYAYVHGRRIPLVAFSLWSSLFFFFGIGFGHARRELLYTLPITLSILPLVAWSLTDLMAKGKERYRMVLLPILLCCLFVSSFSTVYHQWKIRAVTPALSEVFAKSEALMGARPQRLLGPCYFWFYGGDAFRDINGIVLDYFYSAQKRVRACVARYRPDVLIADDEFRRRFQLHFDPATKTPNLVPLPDLIGVPCFYLGSLPANPQHSQLDFYRIDWEKR